MNDMTSKLALAAAALLLSVSAARASGGTIPWKALEQVDSEDILQAKIHAAAPTAAAQTAASGTPKAETPAAAPAAAPDRTHEHPWAGFENHGSVPLYDQPAPCRMQGDPWPGPRCPPDYLPGQKPLACGSFATMVDLAGSVICVSNGVGINQLENSEITAQDHAEAVAYLKARGLAPSAALFAANAMNGKNLQAFTCMKDGFINNTPMQAYGQIEWNLIFFGYVYGPLKGQALTQGVPQTPPAFCSKNYTM